ncbi:MAG: hypothetical protein CMJ40_01075 [Phycisphaerae bacterium]|nr:hypothetical protein [Phycisphaerae bacterium]
MNTRKLTTFCAVVVATSPAMLAMGKTPTASESKPLTNILMGSRADVPYRSDSPVTLSDNRLAFSRIGLRSSRGSVDASGAELSALDDDKSSSVSLPSDGSASLEIQFIGQPRWINEVEIDGTLNGAVLEVLNTDGRWLTWSDRADQTADGLRFTGDAGRYMGLRITPAGLSDTELVDIAEARATFQQADADATNRTEGDGKSYFYEWVENYSSSPLSNTSEDATGLANKLPSDWSIYGYGNCLAWEEDFKRTEYGGTNNSYVDEHDLVFFSGHGSTTSSGEYYSDSTRCITFSNSTHDDSRMSAGDAYDSWGDDDMEWLGLSACQTMKQDGRWAAAMNGVHLVMGWQTNMYDVDDFGKIFAKRMVDSGAFDSAYPVMESWFYAAEKTHGHVDRTAEVIGETTAMGSDYLWGEGSVNSDPTDDTTYTRWSYGTRSRDELTGHHAQNPIQNAIEYRGEALTVSINRDLLNAANNDGRPHITTWVTSFVDVNAQNTGALSDNLCERLGMLCQADVGASGDELEMIAVSGDQEVRIWKEDGSLDVIDRAFYLDDASNMAPRLISHDEAREKATTIIGSLGIPMDDRVLVHEDFLWMDVDVQKEIDGNEDLAYDSIPIRTRTIYRRQIDGLPTWGPGGEAVIELGHDGALAKASVQAWTPLESGQEVQLIPVESLLDEISRRGSQLFINNVRQPMTDIQIDQIEVGYWLETRGQRQAQILPCYGLSCTVRDGNNEPTGMHLVVNAALPAPKVDVQIDNVEQGCHHPGEPVCFSANVDTFDGQFQIQWIDQTTGKVLESSDDLLCHVFSRDLERSARTATIEARVKDSMGTTRSSTATVCIGVEGDIDGNEVVDINDLLSILNYWDSQGSPFSNGDVDGDGYSGIDDLLLILANWNG